MGRMLTKILTFTEFQVWYKLGEKTARRMLQNGEIMALKTPGGQWRIPDPGNDIVALTRMRAAELASVPFIRGVEAADLMNVSDRRVRRLADDGKLRYEMRGVRRVYSLESIAAYMARRYGCERKQTHTDIRPWVRRWAAATLADVLKERGVAVPGFLERELAGNSTKSVV